MSKSATRFLQQENMRFKKEVEALQQANRTLHRYLDTVQDLYWATQQITFEANPLDVLSDLLAKTMSVIGASDGSLLRLDTSTDELVFIMSHGDLGQQLPGYRMPSDTGIAGWVVENRESIVVNHPRQDWRFSQAVDQEFQFLTKSIISVPVMRRDKFIGIIQLLNKRGSEFNESDTALLLVLGLTAGIVIEDHHALAEAKSSPVEEDEQELF